MDTVQAAIYGTLQSLGLVGGAAFFGAVLGAVRAYRRHQVGEPVVPREVLGVVGWAAIAAGYVFAYQLGVAQVEVRAGRVPLPQFQLGGTTNLITAMPAIRQPDRWDPIPEFREAVIAWPDYGPDVGAFVEITMLGSVFGGEAPRWRFRLIDVADESVVTATEWFQEPRPQKAEELSASTMIRFDVPRSSRAVRYRLLVQPDRINGVATMAGAIGLEYR